MSQWSLYQFSLPFHPPIGERRGLIVRIDTQWGEISPLPGRSKEHLALAKKQTLEYLTNKKRHNILFPSVACGLDHASRLYTPSSTPLPLCALLYGTYREILEKAETVFAQGYRTVKVKLSTLSLSDAYTILKTLITRFTVRVDVNQAWSFGESLSFFSRFDQEAFEYIEDPIREVEQLHAFPYPFALDACLPYKLSNLKHLKAIILKPTLVGGLQECLKLKALADQLQVKLVMSSAWESGLGILQLCALSQQLKISSTPLGIDTYRWVKKDLLTEPLDFSHPALTMPNDMTLNMDLLEEVAHGSRVLPDCAEC